MSIRSLHQPGYNFHIFRYLWIFSLKCICMSLKASGVFAIWRYWWAHRPSDPGALPLVGATLSDGDSCFFTFHGFSSRRNPLNRPTRLRTVASYMKREYITWIIMNHYFQFSLHRGVPHVDLNGYLENTRCSHRDWDNVRIVVLQKQLQNKMPASP